MSSVRSDEIRGVNVGRRMVRARGVQKSGESEKGDGRVLWKWGKMCVGQELCSKVFRVGFRVES